MQDKYVFKHCRYNSGSFSKTPPPARECRICKENARGFEEEKKALRGRDDVEGATEASTSSRIVRRRWIFAYQQRVPDLSSDICEAYTHAYIMARALARVRVIKVIKDTVKKRTKSTRALYKTRFIAFN